MPTDKLTAYGVAKAAQNKLTKDLAFEFASKGVRVNSILPGEIASIFPTLHSYLVWLSNAFTTLYAPSLSDYGAQASLSIAHFTHKYHISFYCGIIERMHSRIVS